MKIVKWAAIAVTLLFMLMNLGATFQSSIDTPYRILGGVLALAGIVAAFGLATGRPWGRVAIIVVGGLNLLTAATGLFTDQEGAVIGIVVGGLGVVLGVLVGSEASSSAELTVQREAQ